MKINELCTQEELDHGFSAHYIGFGILIYKGDSPWMQVVSEPEMHEMIREEVGLDD